MRHDPETLAAGYLAGPDGLTPDERARFERHLLTCEPCWAEVLAARDGRELAETLRPAAVPGLRDRLRESVPAAPGSGRPAPGSQAAPRPGRRPGGYRGRVASALLAAAVVAASVVGLGAAGLGSRSVDGRSAEAGPAALDAALAGFRDERLPGTRLPAGSAPDLTPLGLALVAAGDGRLGAVEATMYVYRSGTGQRLALYRSGTGFPDDDRRTHEVPGTESAWALEDGDVVALCGPASHTSLLLGTDAALVQQAGRLLELT